ncbi:hypothetical protein T265_00491 [Opisthorchis viverrini]|uniref:Uncharacterized protein n=1 Tax=Opisthorchis viverrini TaxID=6198 RepID=A0A075AJL5_OPIVI|nr:hypothetical protein T265_00491 [Opisthorchis viverrini]KER33594.1 hypothetical protein T265_00491 [Opisthorchis viverrini]
MCTRLHFDWVVAKTWAFDSISAFVTSSGSMAASGTRWLGWLEREATDRKVRGSNLTSASRLSLSRLRQPGSILAIVLPSGGVTAWHRKGVTSGRLSCCLSSPLVRLSMVKDRPYTRVKLQGIENIWIHNQLFCSGTVNCVAPERIHKIHQVVVIIIIDSMTSVFNTDASMPYSRDSFESLIVKKRVKCLQPGTVRIRRSPSWKASSTDSTQAFRDLLHTPLPSRATMDNRSAVTLFRCLAAMPPGGSKRARILPGCPSLVKGSREADVEIEPRTFRLEIRALTTEPSCPLW